MNTLQIILALKAPAVTIEYLIKLFLTSNLPVDSKSKSARWNLSLTTLDLNKVKRIREKTKAHFNVICAMLQVGALRRFFVETGRVSDASKLPKWLWVPFSTGWPGHLAMTKGGMTNHL
jgi:hypothetical protein